jgi:hypothetical protein
MKKTHSINLLLATVLWIALPVSVTAQQVDHLRALAHGKGTLVLGNDKYKLTGVLVILKENGEAEFTLFTDLQIYAQGQWSVGADPSQGIDLKITGGVFKDAKGTGKLRLRADGKSIATLTGQGTNDSGGKFEVDFVAEEKEKAGPGS